VTLGVPAAAAVLAVAFAELVVRALALAPTTGIALVDAATFDRIPGIFMPSRRWRGVGRSVRFDATIDGLGFRGAGPDPGPSADALRIVFVGDSFVFGDGVADGDTWPAQLEATLACDRPVLVYNAGVPGGSLPEAIAMSDRARALRPDVIVGEFTAVNDVRDLVGPTYWSQMAARRQMGWLPDVALRALSHLGLWNLIRQGRANTRTAALAAVPPEAIAAARDRYAAMLDAWAAELRREGMPLVFALYPGVEMLRSHDRVLYDWALATARRAGLEPVDLWPVLAREGRPPDELYLVPRDEHPSRAGYALAARATADAVRTQVPRFRECRVE
jgi:lysophospholipase L1-like esterase